MDRQKEDNDDNNNNNIIQSTIVYDGEDLGNKNEETDRYTLMEKRCMYGGIVGKQHQILRYTLCPNKA